MDNNTLFSVLIANYNSGYYMQDAINSVLMQSYSNWEVIIVDDGSTDSSHHIYEKYRTDSRFHIYSNNRNYGCGYTKHRCATLANGEICGFLDADDALTTDAIATMVTLHREHPDASVISSGHFICDQNWNVTDSDHPKPMVPGETYFTHRAPYGPEHFTTFKKNAYLKTEGIMRNAQLGDDQDLLFKLEEVGTYYIIPDLLYRYRVFPDSTCHKDPVRGAYWSTIILYETCKRRGLPLGPYSYEPWRKYVESYSQLYNSKEFRTGKAILRPLVWCKRLLISLHIWRAHTHQ